MRLVQDEIKFLSFRLLGYDSTHKVHKSVSDWLECYTT